MKLKNRYFLVRHGESLKNVKNIVACWPEKIYSPLTKKGITEAKKAAKLLKNKKISIIFASDLLRTRQTAGIIAKTIKLKINLDKRLREINLGILNGKLVDEAGKFWAIPGKKLSPIQYYKRRYKIAPKNGETYEDLEERLKSFVKDCEEKYSDKNILIVSHERPLTLLEKVIKGNSFKELVNILQNKKQIKTGEVREI